MKSLLVSLSFTILSLFACASCKSDAENLDVREQYIGTYDVTGTTLSGSTTGSVKSATTSGSDVLVVSKATAAKDLTLSFSKSRYTATLNNDASIFLPAQSEQVYANNGTPYWINFSGDGAFTSKGISLNIKMQATVQGSDVQEITTIKGTKR